MPIRVALHHKTRYEYDRPVTLHPQIVRLRPAPHCRTPILSYALKILPREHFFNWQQDPSGNWLARLVFPKPVREFSVEVDLVAEMIAINPFDFFVEDAFQKYPFEFSAEQLQELAPYLKTETPGPALAKLIAATRTDEAKTLDYLVGINQHVHTLTRYVIRMEPGIQSCEETLTKGTGSCRDSAFLLMNLLRHLGFPSRFCSGYLIQLTADVAALDGPSGPESDFTDLHAWTEVYLPGAGWIGLDATSGLLTGEGHIPLACSEAPSSAAPVTGTFNFEKKDEDDELGAEFTYDMSVRRVHEDPRNTKPYPKEVWERIDALGRKIDVRLEESDVRLTMGGEPTFVSVDDRDGDEWNTTATGPTKRDLADTLLHRLKDRYSTGAFLHHGQGKWYPGETLPRWAFSCYWRKDGKATWNNPELIARQDVDYGHGPAQAEEFICDLARRVGADPDHAMPAYEDAWYYMWREKMLPNNVDPLNSNLADAEERARLATVFSRGLNTPVGFTLPLRKSLKGPEFGWDSAQWHVRREHMYLTPGDSPMGLRLPLDSLPWAKPGERDEVIEEDRFEATGPLPDPSQLARQMRVAGQPEPTDAYRGAPVTTTGAGKAQLIRTALCVQPRDGRLHVFMPPTKTIEEYLELVAAVEETAAENNTPVIIEGYTPPTDPRLDYFRITPDPGVIEVNMHPAASWNELSERVTTLYDEAYQTRLTAEKFQTDGRQTGTGGGNHIIVGGATPADSPVLRRPDLLRSLITCWHNHPSLSYLFSSMFIGPTSQAPRIDEARNDSVYEMELAFRQLPESGPVPSWLVDRIFRHLLIDASGNTHRAEFCIDKLYSPDSSSGRLGLLELRGFEMPPHAQMNLAQQLLIRGLVSKFWDAPCRDTLVRWETELHDRFMLPHFVEQDLNDVLEELRDSGMEFEPEWYKPHLEFRYPLIGRTSYRDVHMELRNAIEPWHVLGEEAGPGGTARYVDSSLERIQVKLTGMVGERHALLVNGQRVPLHSTGVRGEYVAGIRFRAWQPPSCLHPTIPADGPLVFDLVDCWMKRAVAGCTYHVAHPGGRSSETSPVNDREAEGRRNGRFSPLGHTPGKRIKIPEALTTSHFPLTLDMRQGRG